MFRIKFWFIETKAREIHAHSALKISFDEEVAQVDLFEEKIDFFTKSLTSNIDPRDIPAKIRQIEEFKIQLTDPHSSKIKAMMKTLDDKEATLQQLALVHKNIHTKPWLRIALDPTNIPHGFTVSLHQSKLIQSAKQKVNLEPSLPISVPIRDLDVILEEAKDLLDLISEAKTINPQQALEAIGLLQTQQAELADFDFDSETIVKLKTKLVTTIRELNEFAQNRLPGKAKKWIDPI